jgi:signal transduction histidine kinase
MPRAKKMESFSVFLKRHTLAVGFTAFLAPLVVLLVLQYVWLARLERASALAHRATLGGAIEAVGNEVQYFYRAMAERALNVPASIFLERRLGDAAAQWRSKPVPGARVLFLVDYTRDPFGNFHLYDAEQHVLVSPPASEDALAIIASCIPWQVLSYRGGRAGAAGLVVDERDPERRIVLNPITDDDARIVGVAGMVLDEEYFRRKVLPQALKKALKGTVLDAGAGDLAVTVRNAGGAVVYATAGGGKESVTSAFPFVFTDWSIGLRSGGGTPEQWARANFWLQMTLSLLLAVALVGGIALALRAADRAVRLSAMKSDFVSNVSHELRTPLASIRVFGELLKLGRAQSGEKTREYGEYIEAESRRLSRLIDNILDFSRIESGRKIYRFSPADLASTVRETLKMFEVRLRQDGHTLVLDEPAEPLPPIEMDSDAIGQAVTNLLDNAVKYSPGPAPIRVSLRRDRGFLVLSVEDRGIGIARDEQQKIFDRFHRVGSSLVHDVKGSGLGLSIVHHIVQAHRGDVSVASEPGKGSTFSIRLPVPSEGQRGAAEAAPERPAASGA